MTSSSRRYALHIVVARLLHLVDTAGQLRHLFPSGILCCPQTFDARTPVPEGMQPVEPTEDELMTASKPRKGLGFQDRLLLTLGETRRLVCVSDEPSILRAAQTFRVELLNTVQMLDELVETKSIPRTVAVSLLPTLRRPPVKRVIRTAAELGALARGLASGDR